MDESYKQLMKKARKRIAAMDAIDGEQAMPLDVRLRTVMLALHSAISGGRWDTAADAMVMLGQIEQKYRPADSRAAGIFLQERE